MKEMQMEARARKLHDLPTQDIGILALKEKESLISWCSATKKGLGRPGSFDAGKFTLRTERREKVPQALNIEVRGVKCRKRPLMLISNVRLSGSKNFLYGEAVCYNCKEKHEYRIGALEIETRGTFRRG